MCSFADEYTDAVDLVVGTHDARMFWIIIFVLLQIVEQIPLIHHLVEAYNESEGH